MLTRRTSYIAASLLLTWAASPLTSYAAEDSQLSLFQWQGQEQSMEISRFLANSRQQANTQSEALSMSFSQSYDKTHYSLGSSRSDHDLRYDIGVGIKQLSVNYFTGNSEGYTRLENSLSNIDPYFFHGGNLQAFHYNGAALSFQANPNTSFEFASARIKADDLQIRNSHYAGINTPQARGGFFTVYRGSDLAARGFDLNFSRGQATTSFQQINQQAGARFRRLSFTFDSPKQRWMGFEFESGRNTLFSDADENRLMFRFGGTLGRLAPLLHASETTTTEEQPEQPKKRRNGLGVLAGLVVAAGAAGSSGSSNQDNSPRFDSQNSAGLATLNKINPLSVRQNREHGGWIYQVGNGSFGSTNPIAGSVASVAIGAPETSVPRGTRATASYHTHGGPDPRFDNENFSPSDILS
ncbi:MAG: hypothetical protein ACI9FD_003780, partial [Gammaproteobacteria bacterium]